MYVDPGYGALILQSMLAGIAGALFVGRGRVLSFFKWLRKERSRPGDTIAPDDSTGTDQPG